MRVIFLPKDQRDIGKRMFLYRLGSEVQHLLLHVDSKDLACRPDFFRQSPSEVASAGSYLGHGSATWNIERIHQRIGTLFGVASDPVEKAHVGIRVVRLARSLCYRSDGRPLERA